VSLRSRTLKGRTVTAVLGVLVAWSALAPVLQGAAPKAGRATITFNGKPAPPASASASGFSVVAGAGGPQLALYGGELLLALRQGERVDIRISLTAVPGSNRVIATAAAHHAMTAGSIILVDATRGVDGLKPITRLTPDALFPESETRVGGWYAPRGVPRPPPVPVDAQGRAVQIMRSEVYLQPGETASCIGCHEPRTMAPPKGAMPLAVRRPPSKITPGPDGSKPFSYPILVQPVLDRQCIRCHNPQARKGKVVLTGTPQGRYSVSYNALAPRVPFSAWLRPNNSEPTTRPGHFGARGSALMTRLLAGHNKVKLTAEDIERLATWMDANALFYGTFDPADQARQQRGERIAGPKLQ